MGKPSQTSSESRSEPSEVVRSWPGIRILLSLILFAVLAGCQQGDPNSSSEASGPEPVGEYIGQDLPNQVQALSGIPLFFISPELSLKAAEPGAFFLLLAPQDPQRAVLVLLSDETPEAVAGRSSENHELDGTTKLLANPGLAEFVKENYEIELASDDSGNLILLEASRLEIREDQAEADEEEDL